MSDITYFVVTLLHVVI